MNKRKRKLLFAVARVVLLVAIVPGCAAFAQTDSHSETPKGDVVMISLFNPAYPPLARAKQGLLYELTAGNEAVEDFYANFYRPYIARAHGASAFPVPRESLVFACPRLSDGHEKYIRARAWLPRWT
jgi:hypothetical protein